MIGVTEFLLEKDKLRESAESDCISDNLRQTDFINYLIEFIDKKIFTCF